MNLIYPKNKNLKTNKMRHVKFIFLFLCFNLSLTAFSQSTYLDLEDYAGVFKSKDVIAVTNTNIDGSPYFNEVWENGIVVFKNEVAYKVKSLNYNVYTNEFLFRQGGGEFAISNLDEIEEFRINENIFIHYFIGDKSNKSFFQVITTNNKLVLLKKFDCLIAEGKPSTGITPAINDKFKISSEYYYIDQSNPAQEFKIKKNNIPEFMSKHIKEVQTFIDDNKLKLKKEEDLIKVFDYYNTL
jgi:hypothetical protein